MHCKLRKFCSYGSQIPAGQTKHAAEALPIYNKQRKKHKLAQIPREMHLKQTLRNASFAEQKLVVLFQIAALLIQELALPQVI